MFFSKRLTAGMVSLTYLAARLHRRAAQLCFGFFYEFVFFLTVYTIAVIHVSLEAFLLGKVHAGRLIVRVFAEVTAFLWSCTIAQINDGKGDVVLPGFGLHHLFFFFAHRGDAQDIIAHLILPIAPARGFVFRNFTIQVTLFCVAAVAQVRNGVRQAGLSGHSPNKY